MTDDTIEHHISDHVATGRRRTGAVLDVRQWGPTSRGVNMKFMTSWKLHPDHKMDAFAGFSQMTADDDAGDHGPEIKLIGRWHDVASGTGVAITECESGAALAAWIYNWAPMLDATTVPVLDDEEVRAVVSAKLAAQQ